MGTALLAVILALIVWVNATYQEDRPHQDYFPELVPIEVLNLPEGLTITNNPTEHVRVQIMAFQSSWDSLTADSFRSTVDLATMSEGVQPIPVRVVCSDRTVTITGKQPETLYVQLERIGRNAVEVTVDIADREELPLGYAIDPAEVDPQFVSVEGPASLVQKVKALVASVSVLGQRTAVEAEVEPRALDGDGQPVNGVRLIPNRVTVRFDIQKKLNYREVAVHARTKGNPARGYFVSSVNVEPATVTVVGPPAIIASMSGLVPVKGEVDVMGATRMIAERLELELPAEVSVLSDGGQLQQQQILVTVDIDPIVGGSTVELPLKAKKLSEGLVTKLSVPSVDVILRGPAVLLDDLQIELLDAYVDLSGLSVGTHQVRTLVDILVDKDPKLGDIEVTSISPAYVEADIRIPEPTPEPTQYVTPALTLQPSLTTTETITGTIVPTMTVTVTVTVTPTRQVTPTRSQ